MDGVTIGGKHTYTDWGLYLARRPTIAPPDAKIYTVDIPGGDGRLDLTQSLTGEITYDNRTVTIVLLCAAHRTSWRRIYGEILEHIHGKQLALILDDDPDYYYTGRFAIKWTEKGQRALVTITGDVTPYKLACTNTTVTGDFSTAMTNLVACGGTDVSKQSWNTDLRWGTPEIPTYDFSAFSELQLTFASRDYLARIQFVDADLHLYNFTSEAWSDHITVSTATLTGAGLDLTRIYRCLISGRPDGAVTGKTIPCLGVRAVGARKPVVPVITTSVDAAVVLRGRQYALSAGPNRLPDILIVEGDNDFLFFADTDTGTVSIEYQEGWL